MIGIVASSDIPANLDGGFSPVWGVFLFLIAVFGGFGYYIYQENIKRGEGYVAKPAKKVSKKKLERERREIRSQPLE